MPNHKTKHLKTLIKTDFRQNAKFNNKHFRKYNKTTYILQNKNNKNINIKDIKNILYIKHIQNILNINTNMIRDNINYILTKQEIFKIVKKETQYYNETKEEITDVYMKITKIITNNDLIIILENMPLWKLQIVYEYITSLQYNKIHINYVLRKISSNTVINSLAINFWNKTLIEQAINLYCLHIYLLYNN
jgi:hypothetical protein